VSNLDRKIRKALETEDAEFSPRAIEPPLLEQVIDTFRGRSRLLVAVVFAMVLAWMVAAGIFAYQFFQAEGTRAMIAWACGYGLSMIVIALLKIWYWIELSKNVVLREVKRVELRIVRLAEGLQPVADRK
jgi:hypothetical protein